MSNETIPAATSQSSQSGFIVPSKWKIWLGALSLLIPWSLLLFQLSFTWETNEQYAHGYLVPLLCLFLLLKIYPKDDEVESPDNRSPMQGKLWLILGIPLLFAFLPVWLVRGANSDWRLINFALYGIVLFTKLRTLVRRWGLAPHQTPALSITFLFGGHSLALETRS